MGCFRISFGTVVLCGVVVMGVLFAEEQEEGGKKKRRRAAKRKREGKGQEEEEEEKAPLACDLRLDDTLDRTLEDGAKQHNLTAVNVRNILHVRKEWGCRTLLLGPL